MDETTPPTDETPRDLPVLPPQYATGGELGFFTRTTESVPTAQTIGPDGAVYVAELTGLPYPEGYARVYRVGDPDAVPSFDGETPGGVPQVYASGFEEIHSIAFDGDSNLYVLEYQNSSEIYDPRLDPAELPPSTLIKVAPDGVRETISGDELKLGNYVLADPQTDDVYVSINNTTATNGQVLRYRMDPATGEYGYEVVADNLNSPRGLSFGPDGDLYVLEQGLGTPLDDPDVADAPVVQLIPGLVGQRGGYTGSITRVDVDGDGGQERIYEGLPSFQEFNPSTGEDRVLGVGVRGFDIAPDGTVWIASGGGLSEQTAPAAGEVGQDLRGVLRLEGLFGDDPSQATWTREFDAVAYAGANGPDGATTLFNTQSNLNDITVAPDGILYAVDAARNVLYGIESDGETVDSVTVLQKRPPVLTPPQYGAVVEAGGDPSADYAVEINEITFKGENGLPDTPGRDAALANLDAAPVAPFDPSVVPPPRGEDAAGAIGAAAVASAAVAQTDGAEPIGSAPEELPAIDSPTESGEVDDITTFDPIPPEDLPNVPGPISPPSPLIPGPVDPLSPPVLPENPFALYFDPFFGTYSPAPSDPLNLPDGMGGAYNVANVYSFGDRLSENGGAFGKNAVATALGADVPYTTAPYSEFGNFTDGRNWITYLSRILGVDEQEQDTNFAYLDATARPLENPFDPFQAATGLTNFAGQVEQFAATYGTFMENDLVTVSFGGNDLTLPSDLSPDEAVDASIAAIVDGMERLVDLGAQHFLVANVVDVELAPLFGDPQFQEALGVEPGFFGPIVDQFNAELEMALDAFAAETGVDVKLFDVNTLFDAVAAEPSAYGFVNTEEPVLINPPDPGSQPIYNPAIFGQDPAVQHATLFLDPLFHPTALGHSIVAETARNALLEGRAEPSGNQVVMTFVGEGGGLNNVGGYYLYDLPDDGVVTDGYGVDGGIGEGFVAFPSTEAAAPGDSVVIDLPEGVGASPFLIPDGADLGIDFTAFAGGGITFANAEGGPASIRDGAPPTVLANGAATELQPLHGLDYDAGDGVNPLNPDGEIHALYAPAGDETKVVAFEETVGLGNRDFNDALFAFSPTEVPGLPALGAVVGPLAPGDIA